MVKLQLAGVTVSLHQVENPFLLFRREQPLATFVAAVSAIAAQILLDGFPDSGHILVFDVFQQAVEAPCCGIASQLLEERTATLTAQCCRKDSMTSDVVCAHMLTGNVVGTGFSLAALTQKAEQVGFGIL